jgi:hypothetical protein
MRSLTAAIIASLTLFTDPMAIAQTMPVPMNRVPYGPGRIDAITVFEYDGQEVSACGRVAQVDPANQVIVIAGVLRVYVPPGTDAQSLRGTVACATGVVAVQHDGGMRFAVIGAPERVEVIGGTGPYTPPQPQCGPGQMADPSSGGCVKRWRASPY